MASDFFIFALFDTTGFLLSLASIFFVRSAAGSLEGNLKNGLNALIYGFIFIIISFLWSIGARMEIFDLPNFQSLFLSIGMIWILFSVNRLFKIYEPLK